MSPTHFLSFLPHTAPLQIELGCGNEVCTFSREGGVSTFQPHFTPSQLQNVVFGRFFFSFFGFVQLEIRYVHSVRPLDVPFRVLDFLSHFHPFTVPHVWFLLFFLIF